MVNFDLSFTVFMSSLGSMNLKSRIEAISIIGTIKIAFIIFVSFSLFTNIITFYEGGSGDDYVYAIVGIDLANGSYGYTNKLWEETGRIEFVPQHWRETNQDVLVPVSSPGIIVTSALSYLIGGYYGLFYLGPIFSILFLIISERVATKLFGGFVGLITLVLLGSDLTFFNIGQQLLTDNIFAAFFILGVFYLIKFLRSKKDKFILISSIFFVTAAFFRFNGLIFLPIEILLVVGYFIFQNISASRRELTSNNFLSSISISKINGKKILKISALMILPWLSVFLFYFSYNDYYFGDPFTNYYSSWGLSSEYLLNSFFIFDDDRIDSIKFYSIQYLPDIIGSNLMKNSQVVSDSLENLLTIFSFFILILAVVISQYQKNKRIEVFVFITLIMGFLLFYSSDYAVTIGKDGRFMIPALTLTFILFGYIAHRILQINLGSYFKKETRNISKSVKVGLWIIIGLFLFGSFMGLGLYEANKIMRDDFNLYPEVYASKYPLESEGLSSESIIVETKGRRAIEYNASPFIPATGSWVNSLNELDPKLVKQERIQLLKNVMMEGYNAFTFKETDRKFEPLYFRYLESEHGIILKDYSKTFCKMVIIENIPESSEEEIESDDVCYMYRGKIVPKN